MCLTSSGLVYNGRLLSGLVDDGGLLQAVNSIHTCATSCRRLCHTCAQCHVLCHAMQVWSTADNARVFLKSICMFLEQRPSEVGSASFDKDDDLATDFVAAASNLRSACYGIAPQSQFAARGMAGNIIHAIATTNAIISGMIVIEAIKILAGGAMQLQIAGSCPGSSSQSSVPGTNCLSG